MFNLEQTYKIKQQHKTTIWNNSLIFEQYFKTNNKPVPEGFSPTNQISEVTYIGKIPSGYKNKKDFAFKCVRTGVIYQCSKHMANFFFCDFI